MNNRFTEINFGCKELVPYDRRTNEEVLEGFKKLGVEVVKSYKRPPKISFNP